MLWHQQAPPGSAFEDQCSRKNRWFEHRQIGQCVERMHKGCIQRNTRQRQQCCEIKTTKVRWWLFFRFTAFGSFSHLLGFATTNVISKLGHERLADSNNDSTSCANSTGHGMFAQCRCGCGQILVGGNTVKRIDIRSQKETTEQENVTTLAPYFLSSLKMKIISKQQSTTYTKKLFNYLDSSNTIW